MACEPFGLALCLLPFSLALCLLARAPFGLFGPATLNQLILEFFDPSSCYGEILIVFLDPSFCYGEFLIVFLDPLVVLHNVLSDPHKVLVFWSWRSNERLILRSEQPHRMKVNTRNFFMFRPAQDYWLRTRVTRV
ncbi:MAG: hypothetical protein L0Y71_00275 [Gemmataceae bacterium]|nr:hypothetical protein [Gemmataceae bacterium]